MIKSILKLFSGKKSEEMQKLIDQGAQIVDVRTPGEFKSNHVKGSVNIPLASISSNIKKFKGAKKPIILVCASGNRSGQALRFLQSNGIENVYNGGSWRSLR